MLNIQGLLGSLQKVQGHRAGVNATWLHPQASRNTSSVFDKSRFIEDRAGIPASLRVADSQLSISATHVQLNQLHMSCTDRQLRIGYPQAALWDIPVGNPVALCNTQHTGKDILTRPTSEYFANGPDCVVLLRLIPIRPQIFVTVHIRMIR